MGWTRGGSQRLRSIGEQLAPALCIVAAQLVLFPVPAGVAFQGVVLGLLGALVAVGMALVYRANRILNFAQGQLGTAPTVLAVSLVAYAGINYVLALAVGLAGALLLGAVVELAVIRRFFRSPRLILTVATIGLSQLLAVAALALPALWGRQLTATQVRVPWTLHFTIDPIVFSADHVVALVVAPLCLIGVAVLLRRTSVGIAIRASAERADRASLLGVPVKRLQTVVWAAAALLSFIGVFLQAGIFGLPVLAGFSLTVLLQRAGRAHAGPPRRPAGHHGLGRRPGAAAAGGGLEQPARPRAGRCDPGAGRGAGAAGAQGRHQPGRPGQLLELGGLRRGPAGAGRAERAGRGAPGAGGGHPGRGRRAGGHAVGVGRALG